MARWKEVVDVSEPTDLLKCSNRDPLTWTDTGLQCPERATHLASIVDSAMDAIITIDSNRRIVLFNRAAEEMFQYRAIDILGTDLHHLLPERFHNRHQQHIEQFAGTNNTTRSMGKLGELVGRRADGQEFPIEAAISHVVVNNQSLMTVILRDSGLRLADIAQQSHQAIIVATSTDAIVGTALDGTVNSWNPAAERLFGYTANEMIGQSAAAIIPAEYLEKFVDNLARTALGERIDHHETVLRAKSGKRIDVSVSVSCISDDSGNVIGAANIARDITAQKRNETHLRILSLAGSVVNSDQHYTQALEQIGRLIVTDLADWCFFHVFDEDHVLQPIAVTHTDLELEQTLQQLLRTYPHPPDQTSGAPMVARTGVPQLIAEITDEMLDRSVSDPGRRKAIRAIRTSSGICVPLPISGRIVGALTLGRTNPGNAFDEKDLALAEELGRRCALAHENSRLLQVSQHAACEVQRLNVELEARIADRTEDLERSKQVLQSTIQNLEIVNNELDSFSYSVSHDLRAPLRAIDGFARMLQERHSSNLTQEALHYLQRVRHNATQMGKLVDDLLALSRLGRQSLTKRPVDMGELASFVFNELIEECGERTIQLVLDEMPQCQADPALMKQVMHNLIANAIKFTRPRNIAVIHIGARAVADAPDLIEYWVKDNGVGFDMAYAGKLFGVFQRLHRAEEYEGTGVGLVIVQRVIQRHGGSVTAIGNVNEGATISFTLPV